MNLKRAFLILIAATFLPGMAFAQVDLRIETSVIYDDGNPLAEAVVTKVCNDGLPLQAVETLGHMDTVTFVTTDLGLLGWVCTVTAVFDGNYIADYIADGGLGGTDGCVFEDDVDVGDVGCLIELNPAPALVTVGKSWVMSGSVGDDVDTEATIVAKADMEDVIVGSTPCLIGDMAVGQNGYGDYCLELHFFGENPADQSFLVETGYLGEIITLSEVGGDRSLEVSHDCGGSVRVTPGSTASCDFTNTVFFEGIPTLSQYGLAIMALLMLGVGFVGFRRFV